MYYNIFLYSFIYKFELKFMLFIFGKKLEFLIVVVFILVWIVKLWMLEILF